MQPSFLFSPCRLVLPTTRVLGLLLVASVVGGFLAAAPRAAFAQDVGLRFIGQQVVPTGTTYGGTQVGGLSGIDYDPLTSRYYAISDDRSQINPARFYTAALNFDLNAFTAVTFTGVTTIRQPDGSPFPALALDPESIRLNRPAGGVGTPTLLWTNEGENKPGVRVTNPWVREMNLDGTFVRQLTTPTRFNPTGNPASGGVRDNLAFESLSVQRGANRVLTATENALVQDGPAAGPNVASASRLLTFNLATGQPGAEYAYRVEPVAQVPNPAGAFATNGLVEILALDDTGNRFLSVERSFSTGAAGPGPGNTGNTIRVFEFTLDGATDVSNLDTLAIGGFDFVDKRLVLDLATLGVDLDNVEGVTFGPTLANGNRSLVLVSDNNFSATQFTQFLAFEVTAAAVPEPATHVLLLTAAAAGGAGVLGFRRRRSASGRLTTARRPLPSA